VFPLNDKEERQTCSYRKIDNYTVTEFLTLLNYEFSENKDVNRIFSSFLNIYLRIFNASFPKISKYITTKVYP
jgi:hypothetical protein